MKPGILSPLVWPGLLAGALLAVLTAPAAPLVQVAPQAYLKPVNPGLGDQFGDAVAISGDTVVVGSLTEASDATGVNGDPFNDRALNMGAAYVFVRDGTNWTQQAYLKARTVVTNGNGYAFGASVAIDGDTIAVASPGSKDAGPLNTGAVYIFVRNGTNWSPQAILTNYPAQSGTIGGGYAYVGISGDTVVFGATGDRSNATGVNGNPNNTSLFGAGAADVYVRNGTNWTRQAYLKASNTGDSDYFGFSVSISGDTIIVGAREEDSNATGVNGNQANNTAANAGAAYVFVRQGTNWSQQAYLKASNTERLDEFGWSVSVSGDTAVVSSYLEDSNATGVNGNQTNNAALEAGAAYVFVRDGTNWSQQAYLKASNAESADYFGWSVSLSGDSILIGAERESSDASGVNGNQNDNSAPRAGAAYWFTRSDTNWTQQFYLKASNSDGVTVSHPDGDRFGYAVALSGDFAVVGAPFEKSSSPGVNGNQNDNSLPGAGAAYVFASVVAPPPPRLELARAANQFSLSWTGTNILESATDVTGPWLPVTNAVSTHVVVPTNGPQQYFRLRLPEP